MDHPTQKPLAGIAVVNTRPVGHGRALARGVRALGGRPVSLPGLSLRAVEDAGQARAALREACAGKFILFSSPAAVHFAAQLSPLRGRAIFAAVGRGTARALARHGVADPLVSRTTQDSAGLLAHSALAQVRDTEVAVVGAAGGRGALQEGLRKRGARVSDVHVYRRLPAHLDRRHRQALRALPTSSCVLLSSAAAVRNLRVFLREDWQYLTDCTAIVSSARMQSLAAAAGFQHIVVAQSAVGTDMLACAVDLFGARD